ncbi:MAG: rhomboid family intramembrane serine protease [Chthoniobacterales bacterium]
MFPEYLKGFRLRIFQRCAPITLTLIAVNCAIYLLQLSLSREGQHTLLDTFGLSDGGLEAGKYWQLITYQFLHGGSLHLFVNMVGLWFVGREVEVVLKPFRYLFLYFAGGIAGGLLQIFFPGGNSQVLVGASASVFAVMITFTTLFPDVLIAALIFFVIPLRMKAKYLGVGIFIVSILFWLSGIEKNVGHLAHLGGCIMGFILALVWKSNIPPFPDFPINGPENPSAPPPPRREKTQTEEILDKIARHGFDSLSAEDRRLLEEQRARLPYRNNVTP